MDDEREPDADSTSSDDSEQDQLLRKIARVPDVDPNRAVLTAGTQVARFRVVSLLGRGGMGVVYLAEDEKLHRQVALKVLAPSQTGNEQRRKLLVREARAAAAVSHPNIASVYELGETADFLFIAMERVEGETLRDRLFNGPLAVSESLAIADQILLGLGTAHRAGLVHRDLKPENVMVTEAGVVKLLDFGLAKLSPETEGESAGATTSLSTLQGRRAGTPAYMSPEQVVGDVIEPSSDLFAFGVMMYEMLAGRRPFRGATVSAIMRAVVASDPEPLGAVRPDLPAALAAAVMQCLEKAPENRPADASALAAMLRDAERGAPPARRRWLAGAALVCAAVAGASALWFAPRGQGPTAPQPSATAPVPPAPPAIQLTRESTIACPLWEARGVREPAGWLGAAAADLACEFAALRAAIPTQNITVPAGLLGIPPLPSDDVTVDDPFGASDARAKTLAAAATSTLTLDGVVERVPLGFKIAAILRSPEGIEMGRAEVHSDVVSTGVDMAVAELVKTERLLPAATQLPEDFYPQWTRSPEAAAMFLDIFHRSRTGSTTIVADHCRRVLALEGEALPKRIIWRTCGPYAPQGQTRPPLPLVDDTVSSLTFAAVGEGDEMKPEQRAALRARLEQARKRETSPVLQASLLDAEGLLWSYDEDSARARGCALAALKLLPNDDVAVEALADADTGTEREHATRRWAEAWIPYRIIGSGKGPDERLRQLRRSYELNGGVATSTALTLAPVLIERGFIAEAQALSAEYLAGPPPMKRVATKIMSDLAIGEAAFGRGRELLDGFLSSTPPRSWGYGEIGALNRVLRLGDVTSTPRAAADHVLDSYFFQRDKFVYSPIDLAWVWGTILGACWRASPDRGQRCIELFDKTRAIDDFGGALRGSHSAYVEGVKAYVRGDKRGAVRAWKRIAPSDTLYQLLIDVSAFDEIGAGAEASAIDNELMKQTTSSYRGVTTAHVREARRAAKRGDKQRAAELARMVVDAWGKSDVPIPAVDEMRTLLQ